MCYSKLSSLLNSPSHDVRAFFKGSTKSGCKDSANRAKMQIYLRFSEVPPIFWACKASTKVSANRTKYQIYLSICFSLTASDLRF